MTPQRWRQIKQVLGEALLREPSQRTAFLNEACGDDHDLRVEVESLLDSNLSEFMAQPAAGVFAEMILNSRPLLEAGQLLGRYRIVKPIGAGGMGEVYLARDTKLDRKVALKILPPDLAANRDRMERFVREAKSAAALNHPNIATVHEIDESDGMNFIAMEFVDGVTLREKIHQEQTDLRTLLRYLQHAAEGLAKAHAAGIAHRDLKPDNIMITRDGHAKILDFGLAKLVEARPIPGRNSSEVATAMMPQHSSPGTVLGTVGYMSPEQAQGKTKEIDQRSDIFSFGCILFEAVTGRQAFAGTDAIDTLNKIIREPAPPISDFRPDAPNDLQRIVRRCTAKDRDDRYQTIKDVAIELRELRRDLEGAGIDTTVPPPVSSATALSTGGGSTSQSTLVGSGSTPSAVSSAEYLVSGIRKHKVSAGIALAILLVLISGAGYWWINNRGSAGGTEPINSIAVLPFQNKSTDADTDYLSDGLAESLIFRLSQLPGLKVSPTSSVMRYKGKAEDVVKIASELGVGAVMTGRVAQRGDNLTISVELVDARNNKVLWGEQYDRKSSDLLVTQREIAAAIVQKLQLKLSGSEGKGLTKTYTDNNEAYQLYLRGRYSLGKRTKDEMLRAIEYFQQAIKLDPKFALAYARLSETYLGMPAYPYLSPKEALPQGKAAAQKALEIDPTLPEALTFLAYSVIIYDFNWVEGERLFKRAIELDPNNSAAHFHYGQIYLVPTGRFDEGIAEIKRGLELEPLSINIRGNLAAAYFFAGQNDKAMEEAKITYDLEPGYPVGRLYLSQAYLEKGMYAEAVAISEQWLQSDPTNQWALRNAGFAYAKAGRRDKAEEMISRLREIAKTQYIATARIACISGALGDKDRAFDELNKAFAARDWELYRLNVDLYWRPLRDDPRFTELVKRLNLPK
ncbi:MAG: protein kinase [Pyrinomonadaceae bacterium]|nr:protein kinase [Pyrinomonadaceae bacterium]